MEKDMARLRRRYIVFIVSIVLILVVTQVIVQYDLRQQNEDARLLNLAGRQRMLSQRISKLTLFLYYNENVDSVSDFYALDTLKALTHHWSTVHNQLIQQNENGAKSRVIDSLLRVNTPRVDQIKATVAKILEAPQPKVFQEAIEKIGEVELPFLRTMEATVNRYQKESETKLSNIKRVELVLSVIGLVILILEFISVFYPTLKRVSSQNFLLSQLNDQLRTREKDLQQSFEHVKSLKDHLTQSERQYRELVMNASDMIYELDADGKFSFVNPPVETVTGFTKEELYQMKYLELVHPDDRQQVREFYQQQQDSFQTNSYLELRITTKSGSSVWVGQNVKLQFAGKSAYRVNVVARDITQVKEAEARLQRERLLLRTIIDNIPENIYVKNLQSQKILANKAEYEYLGASTEAEILGKSDWELYPDESATTSTNEDARVFAGENIINSETLNTRKDGSSCWFLISKVPLRDENNIIIGLVGISIDITAAKLANQALAEKEKLYRLISENSRDVVSLHNLDGTFEYISPACRELHGYEPEEMIGRMGTDFMHVDDARHTLEQAPAMLQKMLAGESIEPLQFRIATKQHGLVWAENVIKPVYTNGKLSGFQSTVRNISARKVYEAALQEAKEKAEAATKAKSQFLSMMSHEIRTPINGILGLTNLLLEEEPRPDQLQRLNLLKFSGQNLLTIINDVLDFSKAEAGKIVLESVPFNLYDTIQNVVRVLAIKAEEKGLALNLILPANLPRYVLGDSVRLGQILNNLINNAIKFTEAGYVEVKLESVKQAGGAQAIGFSITDTGIGIPADKQESVFESFTQASTDTTRKYGGTGLGLAITKNLVTLMGGQIKITSKPGAGTRFYFEISLPEAFEESHAVASKIETQAPLRILVVDDNAVNREVAGGFLKRWGHVVSQAESGKEALAIIKTKNIDLVLMDLQMPELDGFETTRTFRQWTDEYFKKVPVIALTASTSAEVQHRVKENLMNGYLSKPFKPEDLQTVLARHGAVQDKVQSENKFSSLDQYTEGNEELKKQLLVLFKDNLLEVKQKFFEALENQNPEVFLNALHKAITTLTLINSESLTGTLHDIRAYVKSHQQMPAGREEILVREIDQTLNLLDEALLS
ncbi:MAG: PAS domain S-box protein [Cyclobacteriaceae bacterium]|nr:PAS domain S-box protein [Cyclobacteriaceae bacterium]